MRNHKTIGVTLAAYDAATRHAEATQSDRKTVVSNAILAFVQDGNSRMYRLYIAAAFIGGIALGWLAFGTVL
jgi:hypothetical protein